VFFFIFNNFLNVSSTTTDSTDGTKKWSVSKTREFPGHHISDCTNTDYFINPFRECHFDWHVHAAADLMPRDASALGMKGSQKMHPLIAACNLAGDYTARREILLYTMWPRLRRECRGGCKLASFLAKLIPRPWQLNAADLTRVKNFRLTPSLPPSPVIRARTSSAVLSLEKAASRSDERSADMVHVRDALAREILLIRPLL